MPQRSSRVSMNSKTGAVNDDDGYTVSTSEQRTKHAHRPCTHIYAHPLCDQNEVEDMIQWSAMIGFWEADLIKNKHTGNHCCPQ